MASLGLCCCMFSSCGAWASRCGGFSCCGAQALGSTSSVVEAHRLSCPAACGIFPDQGLNPCPLQWETLNRWTTREVLPWLFQGECVKTLLDNSNMNQRPSCIIFTPFETSVLFQATLNRGLCQSLGVSMS